MIAMCVYVGSPLLTRVREKGKERKAEVSALLKAIGLNLIQIKPEEIHEKL